MIPHVRHTLIGERPRTHLVNTKNHSGIPGCGNPESDGKKYFRPEGLRVRHAPLHADSRPQRGVRHEAVRQRVRWRGRLRSSPSRRGEARRREASIFDVRYKLQFRKPFVRKFGVFSPSHSFTYICGHWTAYMELPKVEKSTGPTANAPSWPASSTSSLLKRTWRQRRRLRPRLSLQLLL